MRILHLVNDISGRGNGIINTVVDIAIGQAERGHVVIVCSAGGDYVPLLESLGVTHYLLDQRRQPLAIIRAFTRLTSLLWRFKPDIVHCHMITGLLLAAAARALSRYSLIAHLHNVHQPSYRLTRLGDRVIAVSQGVASSPIGQGIPQHKLRVVVSGALGSHRVKKRDAYQPVKLTQRAILTVAGMNQRKGIPDLIAAFEIVARDHGDVHLYLVGDGPDRELFEQQAAQSPVAQRIHFEGFTESPVSYMLAADIFVLASLRESLGLVLIEARDCGCAIVATAVDGIPEALDYGKRGILVPPSNPAALAGAISLLLTDRARHQQLKLAARENLGICTVDRMVDEVMAVYQEVACAKSNQTSKASTNFGYTAKGDLTNDVYNKL